MIAVRFNAPAHHRLITPSGIELAGGQVEHLDDEEALQLLTDPHASVEQTDDGVEVEQFLEELESSDDENTEPEVADDEGHDDDNKDGE